MSAAGVSLADAVVSEEHTPERVRRSLVAARVLLGYAIVVSIVPIYPTMPEVGLDGSWKVAINRAAALGLQFGQDIVFTYGPYGGVLTGVYEPGIRTLFLAAATVVAAGFVTAALLTLRGRSVPTHVLSAVAVILLTSLGPLGVGAFVLAYPLLVVAAVRELPAGGRLQTLLLTLLAVPLGLLPVMKVSLVPAAGAAVLVSAFLLVRRRAWAPLAVLVAAPPASLVAWWLAAHQSLPALVDYARTSGTVVAGYTEAMSVHETSRFPTGLVTVSFVLAAAVVLVAGVLSAPTAESLAVAAMAAVTLFLGFKAGFVRADVHMQGGAMPILVAAVVLLASEPRRRWAPPRALVAVVVVLGAMVCWLSGPIGNPAADIGARTIGLARHVVVGDAWSASLRRRYADTMASIRHDSPLPATRGSVDLYTSLLNPLLAQDARWDPRPVIQSYAAYTPELARLNAQHLTGPAAPRTIFFQIGPIDERLPALEDGASWLPLIQHYDLGPDAADRLVLHRRRTPREVTVGADTPPLSGRIGDLVRLPSPTAGSGWLADVDVHPTALGRLANLLWKTPQLRVEVRTADGGVYVHRFIPTMARSDFILSPYVGSTEGFRSLFPSQPWPSGPTVTSIRIFGDSSAARRFWHDQYTLRLRSVKISG